MTATDQSSGLHPLSPLAPAELEAATALLKQERSLTDDFRFASVSLNEPEKSHVRVWPEQPVPRRVDIVVQEASTNTVYEATVCLTAGEVIDWHAVPGVQPKVIYDEWEIIAPLVKADPRWQAAMRRRGVTDFETVSIEVWGGGYVTPDDDPAKSRRFRPVTFMKSKDPKGNAYAHPVGGLTVLVDALRGEVLEVDDVEELPIPTYPGEYLPDAMVAEPKNRPRFDKLRDDVKPIVITQPEGPSFRVEGRRVTWQKWSFIVGWTQREGLVLFDITYDDRGDVRSILHRAAISEMAVPYADTAPTQVRKLAFDAGSVGLGLLSTSLTPGCDCLGYIQYFDGLANDQHGNALVLENAICMHEEDAGIAWKHVDWDNNTNETRRMRRLVVSSIVNAGNYDYGFYWHLYQDGSIELECKLTGIMATGALREGERSWKYGTTLAPGLYAPNHQHFFCARLDMTVDGERNTVTEVNSVGVPTGPDNPWGNAWIAEETPLTRESEAKRKVNAASARYWRITNPNKKTEVGASTAYRLAPGGNAPVLHQTDSPMYKRMGFTHHHLWVTPVRKDEMYAAGPYTWQNPGGDGLPKWTEADRSIENEDIAVWYVFGDHHVPRVEEWPVMPVGKIGFSLRPDGFFDGNPALDLPLSTESCHHATEHAQSPAGIEEEPPHGS